MSLDLAPETEDILMQKAAREGMSVDALIRRAFALHSLAPAERQTSYGPNVPEDDPVLRFLNARIQEAENATQEESAAADAEYLRWQQNTNEARRANGERLLFPEIARS